MVRKSKFKPKITRVKLNAEQAVLACSCWHSNLASAGAGTFTGSCKLNTREAGTAAVVSTNAIS